MVVAECWSWRELELLSAGYGRRCPNGSSTSSTSGGHYHSGSYYGQNPGSSANRNSGFLSLPSVRDFRCIGLIVLYVTTNSDVYHMLLIGVLLGSLWQFYAKLTDVID